MLRVMAPSFLFRIGIITAGKIISAVTPAILGFHCFLKPFFHCGLNGGHQVTHLLVAPFLIRLFCIVFAKPSVEIAQPHWTRNQLSQDPAHRIS